MTPKNDPRKDPIRHIVVLALENHSFDQMLGCFKEVYPALEGVDPTTLRENRDDQGNIYRQTATTERQMLIDPRHEVDHAAVQLADSNSGFVRDFARSYPQSSLEARQFIMGYYPMGFLPALHALARDFTICDHWFSSLPGPTWPNRFFALAGTSNGRVNMPGDDHHTVDLAGWFEQDQDTIFDRLTEKAVHWKVYFHDIPQSSVLCHQRLPHNAARYFYIDEFFDDARGSEEEFPQFCFIEPDFMGIDENDDHPPHDIMRAEKLMADVYNALRANPSLWQSTLLVVFYDEHGGFYDHVPPPMTVAPDQHHDEYAFNQLGVRIPALLISPWIDRRVEMTQFDHTSLLKYLIEKWGLRPLGDRTAHANSIDVALIRTVPRADNDMITRIELTADQLTTPDPERDEQASQMDNPHHKALRTFTTYLRVETVESLPKLYSWAARLIVKIKTLLEWMLKGLYREPRDLYVSIAEPDKLARRDGPAKDDFARFLMHQKTRAVGELAERIRDERLPEETRNHAVHTLALITKRPFQRESDRIRHAKAWLKARGH